MSASAFHNTTKTAVALGGLGVACIGAAGWCGGPVAGALALLAALVSIVALDRGSDALVLRATGARQLADSDAVGLLADVAELAQRAELPVPRLATCELDVLNAYAAGRDPAHAVIVVTRGMLATMSTGEVRGVIAHELVHLRHRDARAAACAAALSVVVGFGLAVVAPGSLVVVPLLAVFAQLAMARRRELAADRGAAELLGTGAPLASALITVEGAAPIRQSLARRLISAHPDAAGRIDRLHALPGRARQEFGRFPLVQLPGS